MRKVFWGQHLWVRWYFAASVGTVTDEVVKECIEKQDVEKRDCDFKISEWLQKSLDLQQIYRLFSP